MAAPLARRSPPRSASLPPRSRPCLPALLAALLPFAAALPGCTDQGTAGGSVDFGSGDAANSEEPTAFDTAPLAAGGADFREWRHPLGARLHVPAAWEVAPIGGSSAFVPAGARAADGETLMAAHFVFLPAPGIGALDSPDFLAAADAEMATLATTIERFGEPEPLRLADRDGLVLRYSTAESGIPGRADLYATLHDGQAIGLIVVGHRARVEQEVAAMAALFKTLRFEAPQRDAALVSTWTRGESYVSGGFSMATEERLELGADGRYARSSQAAGGDAGSSFDSDGGVETGRWYAGEGALLLCGDAGGVAAWSWRIVDGTLVLHDSDGRRSLWQ